MNRAEALVRRLVRFQQRHRVLAFPFAVVQKYGNDQVGGKAVMVAYYGLFACSRCCCCSRPSWALR